MGIDSHQHDWTRGLERQWARRKRAEIGLDRLLVMCRGARALLAQPATYRADLDTVHAWLLDGISAAMEVRP